MDATKQAGRLASPLTEVLGPLPEPRDLDGARWGYDADDMHSYAVDAFAAGVAAERERCIAIVEKWRRAYPSEEGTQAALEEMRA